MIGIDTKVLLRLLLDDDASQSTGLDAWLNTLPAMAGQVHVVDVVLTEASWTLASVYRLPKPDLLKALRALLAEPMFASEHRAAVAAGGRRLRVCRLRLCRLPDRGQEPSPAIHRHGHL